MNSLPKNVTRQRRDCDLNPGPSVPESSTLTTRLPSHPIRWLTIYFPLIDFSLNLCRPSVVVDRNVFRCRLADDFYYPDLHFMHEEFEDREAPWNDTVPGYLGFGYVSLEFEVCRQ